MSSSITKRWVRGSLFFTLALVLLAEGVFLYFTISGYYDDARNSIVNQFTAIGTLMSAEELNTPDEKRRRMIRTVEEFDQKSQYELMLVSHDGSIYNTSSGVLPVYTMTPQDVEDALRPGSSGSGYTVERTDTGEKVMAITVRTPYTAHGIVAMRIVTSLTLVDDAIGDAILMSGVVFAIVILASVVSGVYFIRSIVYPLRRIEATAARIAQGDFDTRIATRSQDEIGSLSKTINHMAEELDKSERMKNEFISSVSHELRTPLTSIKGWAETVGNIKSPDDPNFRRGMEIISGEADRLYKMVEELLDFSRMQNGLVLQPELLDMAAEVEDAVLLSGQRAAASGVALRYTAPALPVPAWADKNRVRQVMINVLDNAIKYSFPGGDIQIEVQKEDKWVRVTVVDEGQGISPEDLENVKTKFYKGRGAVRGSGIGLAVVDEIMKAHGGHLDIESELNKGTEVSLYFASRAGNEQGHQPPKEIQD